MRYSESKEIINKIKESIVEINKYGNIDNYVNEHYQMFLRSGEPDDNTLDTSYYYKMLKEIENDKEFESKLRFVLDHFVKCKM